MFMLGGNIMPKEKTTPAKRTSQKDAAVTEASRPKKSATDSKVVSPASESHIGRVTAAPEPFDAKAVTKVPGAPKPTAPKPKVEAVKRAAATNKPAKQPAAPSHEERQRWIATAAYHRAEQRGFAPGYEMQDWLDAEADINRLIG
jgi:hypothetical protein